MFPRSVAGRVIVALAMAQLTLFVLFGLAVAAHPPLLRTFSLAPAAALSAATAVAPAVHALVGLR
ncbi:hypothetical protein [Phenylobacterium sp.]|jgi:hypothetical protein|uniref:hypothetical protein n=1 Tax=Phenylobacterium sp. TaxID=1871053 RepID=UPI000C8F8B13|nr:hypothetical protein [Phenylobacterium sp.]MAK81913.1 hypothetical protein [Phenylobacterium sp.]MBU2136137.1 hypothetical protein [Alphaproteobacteria bacterium]|tara:strand:+ start:19172 stop:19366 length:195 start_codon:yes stop_codon:yes gene_type:complete